MPVIFDNSLTRSSSRHTLGDKILSPSSFAYWCPGDGFDALPRDHPRPDFQSIQYLSRSASDSQRPILDNSLDNSLGPRSEGQGPGTKVRGPRTLSRGLWAEFRGSSFAYVLVDGVSGHAQPPGNQTDVTSGVLPGPPDHDAGFFPDR